MKKYIKLLSLVCIVTFFVACEDNSDLGYNAETDLGWIQFPGDGYYPAVIESNQGLQEILRVGVDIQVPETTEDLIIGYDLVSVSGLNPNTAFSNDGSIVSPAGETSYMGPDNGTGFDYVYLPTIDFDVSELPVLTEPMIFDVVLRSTNSSNITVGLAGVDKPTTQRVAICPSFNSAGGAFIGDYVLTVPTGDGSFGTVFADDQVVTVSEGNNGPFSRVFQADYLPNIGAGLPVVDIEFMLEDGGNVVIFDGILTGIGCGAQILLGGDPDSLVAAPCGDDSITLNLLDFIGGSGTCGVADEPVTIVLTKV